MCIGRKRLHLCGFSLPWRSYYPILWAFLVSIPFIISAGIFSASFRKENVDAQNMERSQCDFTNFTIAEFQCTKQVCLGAGNVERCTVNEYECFSPQWNVRKPK
eukprot:TRINITY_DN5454_c0_g1_i3.p1 TRINITY_DN5454_c0_g1~~TRINITY_DN5454_c0_g1_i3.p1  ORF type:complete len:104 (+),score=2.90 TRINITY_DN5454_c0_g1_i3:15-326(+)